MHILHITDGIYPISLGGMQRYAIEFTKSILLADKKCKITLVFTDYSRKYNKDRINEINKFLGERSLNRIELLYVPFPKMRAQLPFHYVWESKKWSQNVFKAVGDFNKYDIVYAQGFSGWQKPISFKVPMVVNFHGLNMFQKVFGTKEKIIASILRKVVKQTLLNADAAISLGGELTDIIQRNFNKKVVEIPVGISEDWLKETPKVKKETPTFLFVGRQDPIKGVDLLIEASKQFAQVQFKVVGFNGENTHNLEFLGAVYDENKLKSIYDYSDYYISSGYSEGMPIAILEAFSRGLPVIASDVGATSLLVELNKTGWLFQAGSQEQLNSCIENALRTYNYQDLSSNVTAKAQDFTWSSVAQKHLELFKELLQER